MPATLSTGTLVDTRDRIARMAQTLSRIERIDVPTEATADGWRAVALAQQHLATQALELLCALAEALAPHTR